MLISLNCHKSQVHHYTVNLVSYQLYPSGLRILHLPSRLPHYYHLLHQPYLSSSSSSHFPILPSPPEKINTSPYQSIPPRSIKTVIEAYKEHARVILDFQIRHTKNCNLVNNSKMGNNHCQTTGHLHNQQI